VREAREVAVDIINNVEKVIIGKSNEVRLAVIGLLCQGHVLIEDVPGLGKTMLARSIARSTGCTFKRIQFTPDTLPSDITGVSIYNQKTGDFEFRPGPVMSQVVLADEINRATPKTQSALLEAMEERQVTIDGVTRAVPLPFLVMATQNPVEYEGTFPLPEAQLDRFLLRVHLGYPSHDEEVAIIDGQRQAHPITKLAQVTDADEILMAQESVREIYVDELVKRYIVGLTDSTRHHDAVYLGASPRGSLALFRTSQAQALIDGRSFVLPDDVKGMAHPALEHRIILSAAARVKNLTNGEVIDDCLESVPIPSARSGSFR
jgi:MoxR-like ATPase